MSVSRKTQPSTQDKFAVALLEMKAALDKLDPSSHTGEDAGWQERKSASTRISLLDATVNCLADFGYAKTTTQLVAAKAEISRGAMLHHYNTKADLISATIDYIMFRRMDNFYSAISLLTKQQREEQEGIEIYWKSMQTPEYEAYLELSIASRTDKDLDKQFTKRAIAFDDYCFGQTSVFFPEWSNETKEKQRLAHDLIMCAVEGLHIRKTLMTTRKRRIAVRDYIKNMVQMLKE